MVSKLEKFAKRLIDTPFEEWTNGQLKMETASQLNDPAYIMMLDYEKEDRKYPVTREEMIKFIRDKWSK